MMTTHAPAPEYQPGVCNIGGAEAAQRRRIGWIGTAATLVIGGAMLGLGAPWWSFIVLVLPGFGAATGFIQARHRFCAGYGMHGMSNFGELKAQPGQTTDDDARAADQRRSKKITAQALVAGVVVAVVFAVIAWFIG